MRILPRSIRGAALAALVAAVLLAACAPTTTGSREAPFRADRDGPAVARPGDAVYVRLDVPREVFGLTQADLGGRWQPWTPTLARAVATYRFTLRDLVAPDGWDLTLDRAVAYLSQGRRTAAIEVIVRVQVPSDARLGGQRVRAVLVDQGGTSMPIEIVVQVGR